MTNKNKEIDWKIYVYANGYCEHCGEINVFLPYTCNAHTKGMEKYGHMEFQSVLNMPPDEISYLLNSLCRMVQEGRVFRSGDLVSGIYEDCPVRLDEHEFEGKRMLRAVIPDRNQRFPEDEQCDEIFKLQRLETEMLYLNGGTMS
ncbi:hypothetical protein BRYFOR_08943 [Marvinbryantia formatexigens DSM 14469]|uniref:DUF4262 domain-containing protein n=1 Tax=Marvinbryantia formatexigens DSM 14469 TaxID=478749 RepID=C6LJV6_9FIRM|nr:hypothetical protein [Marvinbryantia formatexigens]EET59034.1 hypothetical protein BRYFOR_08943 [Marvinbryantia formatexigens DSM 14469]UWO23577.1 DUF4262 domain-containing protein [Marvinbryantia formatexigens DSM 14469]SDG84215.1 hypothetical protein SAMN05660368_03387 [Marvinbryantia formatexigens]